MTTQLATEITMNGEEWAVPAAATVAYLLRELDLDPEKPKGIAVAVNDGVVPKTEWAGRTLAEGDRVEVITARQGG